MKWMGATHLPLALAVAAILLAAGCGTNTTKNAAAEAPPPAQVEHEGDANIVQVDKGKAAQFPLATATVISIASGRVVEIRARLANTEKKGQLLLRVQSADIAAAYSDYRKAVAD